MAVGPGTKVGPRPPRDVALPLRRVPFPKVLLASFGAAATGYEVHMPVDACSEITRRTEEAAFRRIESFDANTAAVATLGAVLAGNLADARGAELMRILHPVMG